MDILTFNLIVDNKTKNFRSPRTVISFPEGENLPPDRFSYFMNVLWTPLILFILQNVCQSDVNL